MLTTTQLLIGNPSDPLIENINLSLDSKKNLKIAIVGPNGSGKTTFLKTIAALEPAGGGTINIANEKIVYLSQHPDFPSDKIVGEILEAHIDHHWEFYRIEILLDQFSLDHEILMMAPNKLSGGQQLKVQLIELLLKEPSIILMDEPSNHLDEEGINWLAQFIKDFEGSILLVSHHRGLLSSSVNQIWEIDTMKQSLTHYPGDYDYWRARRKKTREQRKERHSQLNTKASEIRRWLKANEFHPKFRFSNLVGQQKRKLKNLEAELEPLLLSKDPKLVLNPQKADSTKNSRLIKYEISKAPIFTKKKGEIRRGQKVQIKGANGSGKTSFLRIIAGEISDYDGYVNLPKDLKIAWLKQHCSLAMNKTVEQIFNEHASLGETEFWKLLAHFRLKEYRKRKIRDLSGGEQKRVEMALIVHAKPDLLLLDEPTNHLDLYVQEELQDFLVESEMTIIFITHDPVLQNALNPDDVILF